MNSCHEICRLEYSIYRLLSKEVRTPKYKTPRVVVFIPHPVELGEEPMNISKIHKKAVAPEISVIGMVLKPTERSVAEWKKLISSLLPTECTA